MVALVTALAQMGPRREHMDWGEGPAWWMVTMMIVFGVALLGVVVWGIIALARSGRGQSGGSPSQGPSARDILDRRYAAGEIDTADYEERKRLLA